MGVIINIMSTDAQKLFELIPVINQIWSNGIIIVGALVIIWFVIGPSMFVGLGMFLALIPLQGFVMKKLTVKRAVCVCVCVHA